MCIYLETLNIFYNYNIFTYLNILNIYLYLYYIGVHINVSHQVNGNGNFVLTSDHLKVWERENGPLPHRSVMLVNFGWAHRYGNRQLYYNNLQEPYR